ncbi:MAG: MBL fold metallo-hydrolase [Sodaliphilus sp.]
MKFLSFSTKLFGENIFLLFDEATSEAAIIDPGMMAPDEFTQLEDIVNKEGVHIKYILLTHAHIDHACAAKWASEKYGAPIYGSTADQMYASGMKEQAMMFHLPIKPESFTIDKSLKDGDTLSLGASTIQVMATPGHTKGGLVFYIPQDGFAFVGDTIFQHSVGRTDLPGGDMALLTESIRAKIYTLPDNTILHPGHGPATTVEEERNFNPYV